MKRKTREFLRAVRSKAETTFSSLGKKVLGVSTFVTSAMLMALPVSADEGAYDAATQFDGIITAETFSPVVTIFKAVILAVIGFVVGFIAFRKAWGWAKSQITKA